MANFFKKKVITPFVTLLLVVAVAAGTCGVQYFVGQQTTPVIEGQSPALLYQASVEDAMLAEPEEVFPLVSLTADNAMTSWRDGRVLLLSWHKYPESYAPGAVINLTHGEVWTFTDKEMKTWYQSNKNGVSDWNLRFEQLIGLPPNAGCTHFSAFWTDPTDVSRPAYQRDATLGNMALAFGEDYPESFTGWFNSNILYSYYQGAYPWTRLGYTYDWANNGTEYGLTEFLIAKDAKVTVEFTKTTQEFTQWLQEAE